MNFKALLEILREKKWSVQGFNGTPLYLLCAATKTGWMTKKLFGRNYTHFFYLCPPGRVLMHYDENDWESLGKLFYKKITSLKKQKLVELGYKKNFTARIDSAKKIAGNIPLSNIPNGKLIKYTLKCCGCL